MADGKRRVAALTINWNGAQDTLELLDSLGRQCAESLCVEAFVVDNNSAPGDLAALEEGIASRHSIVIHLIKNGCNEGVPAAYNRAIAAAGSQFDYYLRLDNDVILRDGCIARLIGGLEEWRSRGVRLVGCNVRYFDRPGESNGGAVTFNLLRGNTRIAFPESETICDGVLGCVMLVDREVVAAFAPQVFMSWLFYTTDESEISLHSAQRGWRTLYLPQPLALHKGGISTQKAERMATMTSARNWAYLAMRYAKPRSLTTLVFCRLIGVSIVGQLLRGRWACGAALVRGAVAACGLGGPARTISEAPSCER